MPRKPPPTLENLDSLITYKDPKTGGDVCLGFLWDAKERGVFDATLGRVAVTPEQSATHNKLLSEALIKGLDEQCEVGQGNQFYYNEKTGSVTDFIGTVLCPAAQRRGSYIEFERKGRRFRGKPHRSDNAIFIKRIS